MKKILVIALLTLPTMSFAAEQLSEAQCVWVKMEIINEQSQGQSVGLARTQSPTPNNETPEQKQAREKKDSIYNAQAQIREDQENQRLADEQNKQVANLQKIYNGGKCGDYGLEDLEVQIKKAKSEVLKPRFETNPSPNPN